MPPEPSSNEEGEPSERRLVADEIADFLRVSASGIRGAKARTSKTSEDVFQLACRENLHAEITRRSSLLGREKLFIAYSDGNETLYSALKEYFEGAGFSVVRGISPRPDQVGIADKIIQTIQEASCFLGVWTPVHEAKHYARVDGAMEFRGIPSAWMPWELGVAMSAGLVCRVLFETGSHPDFVATPAGIDKTPFKRDDWADAADSAASFFRRQLRGDSWRASPLVDREYT